MQNLPIKNIAFGCMIILMPVLAIATCIEKIFGTQIAVGNIYHSPYFFALWSVLAVSAMIYILCISRRYILIFLHASLVVVLFGAAVSFLTSRRGEMTLQEGSVPASMFTSHNNREKLSFKMELLRIDTCYAGTAGTPCDYNVHINACDKNNNCETFTASLNKPARIDGYSLCIKSISGNSVSFFVSHDPWGTPISYAGYLMTFVSFIMLFFDKRSGFSNIMAKAQYRITYKSIFILACIAVLVLFRITAFSGEESQPILRTPLLAMHVSTIIVAYSLLGCTAINAVIALCKKDENVMARHTVFGRFLLYPATMLLATGIFIGAIWANISWGRYWGWDPKEVWALLTLLGCSITFHTSSLPIMSKPRFFHIYCIGIFVVMLFTYFGVNYLLNGLHSYA